MKIHLIRHLKPLIKAGVCYGRLDIPMDPEEAGEMQMLATNPLLRGAARVWSSPALRCRVLAESIAPLLSAPLVIDQRIVELDFGAWEGRNWDDVAQEDLDRWSADLLKFRAPGGESCEDMVARVQEFHRSLIDAGEDCVVVSHGGPLKILTALLRGNSVDLLQPAPGMGKLISITCSARN